MRIYSIEFLIYEDALEKVYNKIRVLVLRLITIVDIQSVEKHFACETKCCFYRLIWIFFKWLLVVGGTCTLAPHPIVSLVTMANGYYLANCRVRLGCDCWLWVGLDWFGETKHQRSIVLYAKIKQVQRFWFRSD